MPSGGHTKDNENKHFTVDEKKLTEKFLLFFQSEHLCTAR